MSNEALIGIIITVVIGVSAFFMVTKRNTLNINQKTKTGNNTMNNNTIGNEVNINKPEDKKSKWIKEAKEWGKIHYYRYFKTDV